MKKLFRNGVLACVAMATALSFASCSDDDPKGPDPDFPKDSKGVYVMTQGSEQDKIEGMLSFIDYDSQTVFNDVFTNVNKQSLGNSPQCGIVYDEHVYLGIFSSGIVWVLDKDNKIVKKLEVSGKNQGPRSFAAQGGYVYASLYDGHVIKIDAKTFDVVGTLTVGPNPETMCIYDGYLYVPNSDGVNSWTTNEYGKTATKINLSGFTVAGDITVPENPSKFFVVDGKLYLLSMGNYGDVNASIYKAENDKFTKVIDATMVDAAGETMYIANYPFNDNSVKEFKKYNVRTGVASDWNVPEVVYPGSIAADPLTGNVFVASYVMNGTWPSYTARGFICQYSASGAFVKKYDIGVGPAAIFFNLGD